MLFLSCRFQGSFFVSCVLHLLVFIYIIFGKANSCENYIKYAIKEVIDPKTANKKWRGNVNDFGRNSEKF